MKLSFHATFSKKKMIQVNPRQVTSPILKVIIITQIDRSIRSKLGCFVQVDRPVIIDEKRYRFKVFILCCYCGTEDSVVMKEKHGILVQILF